MKPYWLAAAGLALGLPALAQQSPGPDPSLPPLQQQWQQEGSPPVQQAPVPPSQPSPYGQPTPNQGALGQTPPAGSPPGQAPDAQTPPTGPATADRPNVWVPGHVAKVQALDKVTAQTSTLTIKVGDSATFGSLTITAKACVTRPIDQPADAAAYLTVTDSHADSPGFNGWMLKDEPSISMMEHPIYDLRVVGCS